MTCRTCHDTHRCFTVFDSGEYVPVRPAEPGETFHVELCSACGPELGDVLVVELANGVERVAQVVASRLYSVTGADIGRFEHVAYNWRLADQDERTEFEGVRAELRAAS